MKNATATWALVVGIDEYDDPKIRLKGAARDALSAVRWLGDLGVPASQILLHADPCEETQAQFRASGTSYKPGTFDEIRDSILSLRTQPAERLFVFLSGHGLYEWAAERVFLTREANPDLMSNIGLAWLCRLLRSMPVPLAVVVMDGCLNVPYSQTLRSKFKAGEIPALEVPPARANTTVVSCFAASQGERALELDGRGLFTRHLLGALDPGNPDPDVVDIDDATGERLLDLRTAILDVVSPTVASEAAAKGYPQHPTFSIDGLGLAWDRVPVVTLTPAQTARVSVTVDPTTATQHVKQIRIWADDTNWERRVPAPPMPDVRVPIVSVVPAGTALSVHCRLKNDSGLAAPGLQEVVVDADRDIVFSLGATPPIPPAYGFGAGFDVGGTVGGSDPDLLGAVFTVDGGLPAGGMTDAAYAAIDDIIAPHSHAVMLERNETGAVLRRRGFVRDWTPPAGLMRSIAAAINVNTDDYLSTITFVPPDESPTLRLVMNPAQLRALEDAVGDTPVVFIGSQEILARDLRPDMDIPVDAGPVTVRLELPWGRWSTVVDVDPAGITAVQLPERVGLPPVLIDVVARHDRVRYASPGTVFAANGTAPIGWLVDSRTAGPVDALWPVDDGISGLHASDVPADNPWGQHLVVAHRASRLAFALHPTLAMGLDTSQSLRVEPLPNSASYAWHALVSSGRLDALTPEQAVELTRAKWDEPVLGIAGAYACLAQDDDKLVRTVLDNLRRLIPGSPDVAVLHASLDRRRHRREKKTRAALEAIERDQLVPVFQWGVSLGVRAAEHFELSGLRDHLADIESRVVPTSVWTMWKWHAPSGRELRSSGARRST